MRQRIRSIKGYFRGVVTATARPAGGGAEFRLTARSSDADWGQSIQVKSGEEAGNARLWVTLGMPDKPDLAGKEVECHIDLAATFPVADPAGKTFHVAHGLFQDTLAVQLGPPHSGGSYRALWWFGVVGGMACFLVSGLLRLGDARRLRRQALPTRVLPIAEGEKAETNEAHKP
jgi:hypothetical protein